MPSKTLKRPNVTAGLAIGLLCIVGCSATNTQIGSASTYRYGSSLTWTTLAAGAGIMGFGGYAIWLAVEPFTAGGKRRFRASSMRVHGRIIDAHPKWTNYLTGGIGAALILLGLIVALWLPPRLHTASLTVQDDRFVIVGPAVFEDGQVRTFRFSELSDIRFEEPVVRTKRAKDYLVVEYLNGQTQRIKAEVLERAAYAEISQRFEAFRSVAKTPETDNPLAAVPTQDAVASGWQPPFPLASSPATEPPPTSDSLPSVPPSDTTASPDATVSLPVSPPALDPPPTMREPAPVATAATATNEPATGDTTATTAPLPKIKRWPINIELPPGGVIVPSDAPLRAGVKLGATWARKWDSVTVRQVYDDGTVQVDWDGWTTSYRMVREDLAIDPAVLASLGPASPTGGLPSDSSKQSSPRIWSDKSGSFSVEASYEGIDRGKVSLRKTDGTVAVVPLSQLSLDDQKFVRQQIAAAK